MAHVTFQAHSALEASFHPERTARVQGLGRDLLAVKSTGDHRDITPILEIMKWKP